MKIIPYEPRFRSKAEKICLATASQRARCDDVYRQFTLWMYCDPYLDHETAYLLLDETGSAAGYILCAENFEEYCRRMAPYAEKIRSLGEEYARRIDGEMEEYGRHAAEYPAHMHIDILDSFTGKGSGTALLGTLTDHLKQKGVRGLMLGVGRDHMKAVHFYQKNRFQVIEEDEGGFTMGLNLEEIK